LDDDAVRGVASWSTIKVVLLDVNSVDGDVFNANVLVVDVGDETGGVGIRLDAGSVFGVQNNRVCE